jgi:hypothetical protein
MAAAELLVLSAVVAGVFWLLTPIRRRIESWLARRMRSVRRTGPRRVVVLGRRPNGTYSREDGHER